MKGRIVVLLVVVLVSWMAPGISVWAAEGGFASASQAGAAPVVEAKAEDLPKVQPPILLAEGYMYGEGQITAVDWRGNKLGAIPLQSYPEAIVCQEDKLLVSLPGKWRNVGMGGRNKLVQAPGELVFLSARGVKKTAVPIRYAKHPGAEMMDPETGNIIFCDQRSVWKWDMHSKQVIKLQRLDDLGVIARSLGVTSDGCLVIGTTDKSSAVKGVFRFPLDVLPAELGVSRYGDLMIRTKETSQEGTFPYPKDDLPVRLGEGSQYRVLDKTDGEDVAADPSSSQWAVATRSGLHVFDKRKEMMQLAYPYGWTAMGIGMCWGPENTIVLALSTVSDSKSTEGRKLAVFLVKLDEGRIVRLFPCVFDTVQCELFSLALATPEWLGTTRVAAHSSR